MINTIYRRLACIIMVFAIFALLIFDFNPVIAAEAIPTDAQKFNFQITSQNVDFSLSDSTKEVKVILKNTGSITWTSEERFHLSYHWLDAQGKELLHDGLRTDFPQKVKPGETIQLKAKVLLPEKPGEYKIQWDMVQEDVTWFSEKNSISNSEYSIKVFNKDHFIIGIIIVILLLIFIFIYLLKNKKIIIPSYIGSSGKIIWSKVDLIWFVLALYYKITYFSYLTHISMTNNAKVASFLVILFIGIILNLLKQGKGRILSVFLLNMIFSVIILSDMVYISYFGNVLSIPVLLYMSQASSVKGSINQLIHLNELYIFADLIFGILLLMLPSKKYISKGNFNSKYLNKKTVSLVLFIVILLAISNKVVDIDKESPGIFVQRFSNSRIVESAGLLNYHAFDAYKFISMSLKKPKVTVDQLTSIESWFKQHEQTSKDSSFGIAKQKNVIVVQVEALQQFVIGLKINNQEVTPNLNNLIKDSMYYNNYFDQTNQGRTSDGEFTSLVSLHPLNEGSIYFSYPQQDYESLPKILKQNGYFTFSAHAYDGEFWNRKTMHQHLGFDTTMFGSDFSPGENISWGLSDKDFLVQSINRISTLPHPFFSFLITLSNHHPYDELPTKYKVFDEGEAGTNNTDNILKRYLNTVHYTDMALGVMIDELKKNGLYDNTVLAIYGDHDSAIDIHDLATVISTDTQSIDAAKWDKVPLIMHIPGYTNNKTDTVVSGHLDLAPSLLHVLGIPEENHFFMGNNLFVNEPNRLVIFKNGSFVDQSHYFLSSDGSTTSGQCYDLNTDRELSFNACSLNSQEAQKRLDMSDLIIQSNLIPKLK